MSTFANIPIKSFPFNYLGCPLIKGRTKKIYFEDVLQKFRKRLDGWYTKMWSTMGRLILVKSILSSIPIHLLAFLNLLKVIKNKMNSIMAGFIWSNKARVKKRQ